MRRIQSLQRTAVILSAIALCSDLSAQTIKIPPYGTVAQLGACTNGSPKHRMVTDGATNVDCSTGGGSIELTCECRDGAWVALTVAGFTASKCARFDSSGKLAAASGDCASGAGTGDVAGPASAVDNHVPRFDGTTGKLLQDSAISVTDAGQVQLGGTSSSFPSLLNKSGEATVEILAADSTSNRGNLLLNILGTAGSGTSFSFFVRPDQSRAAVKADGAFCFSSTSNAADSCDAGIARVATGVTKDTDGSSGLGWRQWAGECGVDSDQTNATTSFASTACTISGLVSGRKYPFVCSFFVSDSVAADGVKIDFQGGTATETSFRAQVKAFDTALALSLQVDDITDSAAVPTLTGDGQIEVSGHFIPSGAGTFLPRFAQNAHTAGTLTLYAGSHCIMWDRP